MKYEKLLATRYIKAQKRQSVFTIVSIAAAVAVMTMFFLLYSVLLDCMRTAVYNGNPFHVSVSDLTEQQGKALQNEPHVELVKLAKETDGSVTAYVQFGESCGDQIEWTQTVAKDLGIKGQLTCNWNSTLMNLDLVSDTALARRLQTFCAVFILVLFIAFALRMVIDTAFEVSSKERERHYGVLQSIGATPQQIVKIITSEAVKLCIIGIPLGLAVGIVFAYGMYNVVLNNGIIDILNAMTTGEAKLVLPFSIDPLMLLVAAVTGAAWVFFSAYGVGMRIIKKNPIEAIMSRTNNVEKVKKHPILGLIFGVSGRMASRNARRQKKRFFITVLTLTVSITLFGCFTSVSDYLRKGVKNFIDAYGSDSDFYLHIDENKTDLIYESGLFKDIGISDIKTVRLSSESNDSVVIEFINEDRYDKLFDGITDVSYEELVNTVGFIVNPYNEEYDEYASLFEKNTGGDISGYAMKKTVTNEDKNNPDELQKTISAEKEIVEIKMHIAGIASKGERASLINSPVLIGAIENIDLWGKNVGGWLAGTNALDCNCSLINGSKYKEAIELFEKNTSCMELIDNMYEERTKLTSIIPAVTAGVLFINVLIGIIAIINLMNIVSTGIANRKSEFASLQCLGMTRGQLVRMAALECMQFTLTATVISAVLCSLLLVGLDIVPKLLYSEKTMSPKEAELIRSIIPKINYTATFLRIAAASCAAYLTAFAASLLMLKRQNEDSLTDQIRGTEMHISSKDSHFIRNAVIAVISAFVLVIAGLRIYSLATFNSNKKAYEDAGYINLVESNGFKMNVYITGAENGKHTIVGLAGQGLECFPVAAKEMTAILGQENKVVFPDRAGNGFSEDTGTPQTVEQVVEDYRTGLKNAGVSAPYVLMGHSYGGTYAVYWQLKYPEEVEAVVFLDSYYITDSDVWQMYESEDPSRVAYYRRLTIRHWLGLDRLTDKKDNIDPTAAALFSDEDMKLIKIAQGSGMNYDTGTKAYASECLLMKEEDRKMNEIFVPTDIPKLFIAATPTCEEDLRELYEFMKADYDAAGKEFDGNPAEMARKEWKNGYRMYQDEYLYSLEPFMKRLGNCRCKAISGEHAFFYAQKPQETAETILKFIAETEE